MFMFTYLYKCWLYSISDIKHLYKIEFRHKFEKRPVDDEWISLASIFVLKNVYCIFDKNTKLEFRFYKLNFSSVFSVWQKHSGNFPSGSSGG